MTMTESINIMDILKSSSDESMINESGTCNRIHHLYDDYKMTFNEMRQIFRNIFSGKTTLTEKLEGPCIMVTYKDGNFCFAKNKRDLRDPISIEKIGTLFNGENVLREAYVNSANDIVKALNQIEAKNLNRLFANGQNFINMQIVYPPCKNVLDYGNRCILQLNGVDMYDSKFNKIGEDKESSKWMFDYLGNHKALKQEMFEIEAPRVLRMKDSISAGKALEQILEDFNSVIDGYSTRCTIKDYANERLRRYIINVCNHNNLDVDRDCQFVRELADRIGNFSGRRPTKSDICTFAKRAGLNVNSEQFRNVMEEIELKRDAINEEVMRPVENLIMKAGVLLLKNLRGYLASDPQRCSQRMSDELESVLAEIETEKSRISEDRIRCLRRHFKRLGEWRNNICPTGGVYFKYNGKTYKVNGNFGDVCEILRIFGGK